MSSLIEGENSLTVTTAPVPDVPLTVILDVHRELFLANVKLIVLKV